MNEFGYNHTHSETAGSKGQKKCALENMNASSDEEEEGYVSPYNYCSSDDDNDQSNRQLLDELPVFSTQSFSPSGRSLSPIDMDTSPPRSSRGNSSCNTPYDSPYGQTEPACGKDYVTLEEVQARIGMTPPSAEPVEQPGRSPRLNLETIFEDKFLETPPKAGKEFDVRTNQNQLLRRSFRNRTQMLGAMGGEECGSVSPTESLSKQFSNKVVLN
ncbi:AAEL006838-PA [Aedes aegypti]|uniref:AAEL006838-PA n=1 Tax=Aedes aegypti TaxID=7159 RepID=Q174N8_AEDAE|nr:AAEL006838-PA [Aedes aegypti]